MKWYEREYTFKNQPYPTFLADVMWSVVVVMLTAVFLFVMEVGVPGIAVAASAVTLLLARMMVRRRAEYRAKMGLVPRRGLGITPLTRGRPVVGN